MQMERVTSLYEEWQRALREQKTTDYGDKVDAVPVLGKVRRRKNSLIKS